MELPVEICWALMDQRNGSHRSIRFSDRQVESDPSSVVRCQKSWLHRPEVALGWAAFRFRLSAQPNRWISVTAGERHAQYPLSDWPFRQDLIDQMRSTVSHAPCATRGTESPPLATEGHQLLMMTRLTSNPQKSMLQATTLQVILEFSGNVIW